MKSFILHDSQRFHHRDKMYHGNELGFQKQCKAILPEILTTQDLDIEVFYTEALLFSDFGDCKPDLLAISKDYSYFAFIEVETSNHDLESDVLDQMTKMTTADHTLSKRSLFENLCKNNSSFKKSKEKFYNMLENQDPNYLLISDKYLPTWQSELARLNTKFIAISLYKDKFNNSSYHFTMGPALHSKKIVNKASWESYKFNIKGPNNRHLSELGTYVKIMFMDKEYCFEVERKKKNVLLWQTDYENVNLIGNDYSNDELLNVTKLVLNQGQYILI